MPRKKMTWMFLAPLLLGAPPLHAHGGAAQPSPTVSGTVEDRLKALEDRQVEIYHSLAEKKDAGIASPLTDRLTISGLLEVEGSAEKLEFTDGGSDSSSDLILATAQLTFGIKLLEGVTADLGFLFEEGAPDLEVDEAAVNLSHGPWFGRLGRQYLPFGVFRSHFISDPLTLELGETRETALLLGYRRGLAALSVFAFNGRADKRGEDDHVRDWGASLVLTPMEGLEVGASYLSDLADSNAELLNEYRRRVGGWSAFANAEIAGVSVSGEVLGALRPFAAADLDADQDGDGDRPLAWNLELAAHPHERVEVALRYEGSRELAGQPRRQYGVDVSWSPWEQVTVSLEYLHAEFEHSFARNLGDQGDSPARRRDRVTGQLAFEF